MFGYLEKQKKSATLVCSCQLFFFLKRQCVFSVANEIIVFHGYPSYRPPWMLQRIHYKPCAGLDASSLSWNNEKINGTVHLGERGSAFGSRCEPSLGSVALGGSSLASQRFAFLPGKLE